MAGLVRAIADDGHGRFLLNRNDHARVVRPHRDPPRVPGTWSSDQHHFAVHDVCDLPVGVRAVPVGGHIERGTRAQNLPQMAGTPLRPGNG